MKSNILILSMLAIVIFSSCEIIVIEEPVPTHVDYRDYFLGRYTVEEYNPEYNEYAEYRFTISKSSRHYESVVINNFYGLGLQVIADIEGYDIYIPDQEVDGYHIEGSGYLDRNELILTYTIFDHYGNGHSEYFEVVAYR